MIKLKIINRLKERLKRESKEYRKKTAQLLTDTAVKVRRAEIVGMNKQLHKPTPFTQRGVVFTPAREKTLTAVVYIRPIQAGYLIHQVTGMPGTTTKPVPTTQAKNKYGNLPRKASKRKRAFVARSKRTGKRYLMQRKGKREVILLATWSDRRSYHKGRYDFYGIAKQVANKHLRKGF